MRIYNPEPTFYIRLTFKRKGDKQAYVAITDSTLEEVYKELTSCLMKATVPAFQTRGYKTSIELREAIGGQNGKYKALSFWGLSPEQTKTLVINHINSLNHSN